MPGGNYVQGNSVRGNSVQGGFCPGFITHSNHLYLNTLLWLSSSWFSLSTYFPSRRINCCKTEAFSSRSGHSKLNASSGIPDWTDLFPMLTFGSIRPPNNTINMRNDNRKILFSENNHHIKEIASYNAICNLVAQICTHAHIHTLGFCLTDPFLQSYSKSGQFQKVTSYTQFTLLTPTQLNCRVELHRLWQCELNC